MADLLREIDEELQREHMMALWAKYKQVVLTLALALVVGTASYSAWQDHSKVEKTKRSVALYDIMSRSKITEAEKLEALQGFVREFQGKGQAIIARFVISDIQARSGALPQAVATLENVAQDQTVPELMRKYAGFQALQLQIDTGDAAMLRQKLEPFLAAGEPWRFSAKALQGLLLAKNGDSVQANAIFSALVKDDDAPTSVREYAHELAAYYATKE